LEPPSPDPPEPLEETLPVLDPAQPTEASTPNHATHCKTSGYRIPTRVGVLRAVASKECLRNCGVLPHVNKREVKDGPAFAPPHIPDARVVTSVLDKTRL